FSSYLQSLFNVSWWVILFKLVGGAFLGSLIALSAGFEEKPDNDTIVGGVFVAFVGLVISLLIPVVFHWSINLLVMPLAQFLLVLVLMSIFPEEESD
ncbi:MAG: hypothetical protein AAFO69_11375, partial [Bacteroidota bacterium]